MNEFTQNPWNPSPWLLKHSERRKKWRKKHQTWSPMWTSPFTHVNSRCELSLLIVKTTYQTYHITWNIPERWEKVVPTTNTSWWSHTKYGVLCHIVLNVTMVTFRMALPLNKRTNNVMDYGWVHPLAKNIPSLVSNLRWNIVMDEWYLDENPLCKWQ